MGLPRCIKHGTVFQESGGGPCDKGQCIAKRVLQLIRLRLV